MVLRQQQQRRQRRRRRHRPHEMDILYPWLPQGVSTRSRAEPTNPGRLLLLQRLLQARLQRTALVQHVATLRHRSVRERGRRPRWFRGTPNPGSQHPPGKIHGLNTVHQRGKHKDGVGAGPVVLPHGKKFQQERNPEATGVCFFSYGGGCLPVPRWCSLHSPPGGGSSPSCARVAVSCWCHG